MTKSALAKDPSLPSTSRRGNWKYKNTWVNKEGFKVDNYGKVLPGQKTPFVPTSKNPFQKGKETEPKAPPKARPTAEERIKKGTEQLVEKGVQYVNKFDPRTFQQQYQPQFAKGMQRAYDTVYGQFERQNQERFAREQDQLQQSLVERGLDPAGEAYQSLSKQLADQQNAARQDAQAAAWQAAQSYQQQGYEQATGAAMLPVQLRSPFLDYYNQLGQRQFTSAEAEKQRAWEAEQERIKREWAQKMRGGRGGGGGGGGGGRNPYEDQLNAYIMSKYGDGQGNKQPSNTDTFVNSVGSGAVLTTIR